MRNSKRLVKANLSLYFLVAFIFSIDPIFCFSQSGTRYTADLVTGSSTPDGPIREYNGNVHFWESDWMLTCDHAIAFISQSKSDMRGNVIFTEGSYKMKTPHAIYNEKSKICQGFDGVNMVDDKTKLTSQNAEYHTVSKVAFFDKNVFYDNDTVQLKSQKLIYERVSQNIFAKNAVFLFDRSKNSYLFCDTLDHFKINNKSIATGKPLVFKIDSGKSKDNDKISYDTIAIKSNYMLQYSVDQSNRFLFQGNVEIQRGEVAAIADSAYFDNLENTILLMGKPIVWFDNYQLYGDTIRITLEKNQLKKIETFTNSIAVSQDSMKNAYINQLAGTNITIFISDNKLEKIIANELAKSVYFLSDDFKHYDAKVNDCKQIEIEFENGKPSQIHWIKDVNGNVYPAKSVKLNPKKYYLPNFRFSNDKPKKKTLKLN